jgi:hypothetical protein
MYVKKGMNMKKQIDDLLENCVAFFGVSIGAIIVVALLMFPLYILKGFVISKLWLWFVVPYFGLEPLSIPLAIGLGMIVSFVSNPRKENDVKIRDTCLFSILLSLLTLLSGWIVHLFI